MGMMKNLGIALLEDMCFGGAGSRKEIWDRTQICFWPQFKRLFSSMKAQGMIEVAPLQQNVDNGMIQFQLTKAGEDFVQSVQ
tara:strand:+ start:614 stop:859 length:246 start_codon:yes stop_codon:yes gene_type:complete